MRSSIAVVTFVFALAFAFGAAAEEHYHEKAVNADTKEKFAAVSASVIKQMEHGGRYEFVTPTERQKIEKAFAEMNGMMDKYGSVAAMDEKTKIALFNNQEVVNSILTHRDRDRVICKHEVPVGSHIPVTTCHTYAQEVEAREGARKQWQDWSQRACVSAPSQTNKSPYCFSGGGGGHGATGNQGGG